MSDMIRMLLPRQILDGDAISQVMECNQKNKTYRLALNGQVPSVLIKTRNDALTSFGRIEFGGGILPKLIETFRDSPYLYQGNYASMLHELTETFYYFKNESLDRLSDGELLSYMRKYFDTNCHGSIELLQCRELEQLTRAIRYDQEESAFLDQAPDILSDMEDCEDEQ